MKRNRFLQIATLLLMGGGMLFTSCSDDDNKIPTPPEQNKPDKENGKRVTTDEQFYANHFAHDILDYYYYWNKQIASDLDKLNPMTNTNPIKTVNDIKYHQGEKFIDKWTMLTDDMAQFESGVAGISTTYGYQPLVYRIKNEKNLVAAVAFVYKNSPASKAGLQRGDLIYKINGNLLNENNYKELFYSSNITLSLATLKQDAEGLGVITPTGKDVKLNAIQMYEDPILLDSVYTVNDKKIGYLAYTGFDLTSIPKLIEVSKRFKAKGVKELILDLRYNGGGYVITETAMASMYAPQDVVNARKIFEIEKYNTQLTKDLEKQGVDNKTPFTTDIVFKDQNNLKHTFSTKDANIGIDKIYGLITGNSASASEALLSGLMPYMNVELIGTPSHGKYCTGWMISAKDAYKKVPEAIKNWGIYVMVAIYQNAKGETPCMPDGLQPQYDAFDDPLQPVQLGDANEEMLKVALQRAGKVYDNQTIKSRASMGKLELIETPQKANFGKRILIPEQLPTLHE